MSLSELNERRMEHPACAPLEKDKSRLDSKGIVYISSIPKHMNVTILRELLQPTANVGRIYMQPECKGARTKKRTVLGKRAALKYTEAWVEFSKRREARLLAKSLNAQPISTSPKSVFCDILWSMKYLPRYTWVQLSERLSYEKAVGPQKLRAEMAQARKEAAHFQTNLDRSLYQQKRRRIENHETVVEENS